MKQNWEISELEKCLEKVTYTNKIQRKDFKDEGIYPIVSQEKEYINGYWDNENDLFLVEKPVVIFGDHTQVLKYVDFSFVLGADGVKILIPKKHIDSRYFYYYMQNVDLGSLGYARHYRLLKEIDVQYPSSLPEQQRIVSILDEAFAAIDKAKANAEQNLKNAKELFESYLQGVFENGNWEERILGDLCTLITKGSSPKWQGINYVVEPGILFVTSENVGEGKMLLDKRKYVEAKFNEKDKKSILKKGDVLTNIVGASIGRTAIYDIDDVANINQAVCILRCNPKLLNNFFLMNLLNSPFLRKILHDNEVNTARANLSLGFFNKLSIPFPSLEQQETIVSQLGNFQTETKKMEAIYQKKIADLEELKKSVLQKAFAGELNLEAGTEPVEVAVPKTKK